jgi:hypothetical protein
MSLTSWSFVVAAIGAVTGIGGLVVAVAGWLSSKSSIEQEQRDRQKAIEDAWAFEWAAQRPLIYPRFPVRSGMTPQNLLIKNGGRGPAINVVRRRCRRHGRSG